MDKKIIVISLGGSVIVSDSFDLKFLEKFKKTILKFTNKYKFVIVTGGGSIARNYINALRKAGKPNKLLSMVGISVTRLNARFMTYFFGKDASSGMPHNMKQIKNLLGKKDVIFCGALRYHQKETSDSTTAKIANFFKTDFINITNVPGLYTKNPIKFKDAKFIPKITWKNFWRMANRIKYKPGQNFILDQHASEIIMENKIKTYLIGKDMKNLKALLEGRKFKGSVIDD